MVSIFQDFSEQLFCETPWKGVILKYDDQLSFLYKKQTYKT